jgi:hypothetical protein
MHLEGWVGSHYPRIVLIHKELDGLHGGILHFLGCLGIDSLDLLQMVDPNILSSNVGKDISWEFHSFKANSMDKVASIAPGAPIRSMIVPTWNRSIVPRLDH